VPWAADHGDRRGPVAAPMTFGIRPLHCHRPGPRTSRGSQRLGHEDVEPTPRHGAKTLPDLRQRATDTVDELFGDVSPR